MRFLLQTAVRGYYCADKIARVARHAQPNSQFMNAEPGAVENRLSLNPSEFPEIADWEDGQRYEITIGGKKRMMTQISPGEFEVESPREQEPEATAEKSSSKERMRSRNPAVSSMIEETYS